MKKEENPVEAAIHAEHIMAEYTCLKKEIQKKAPFQSSPIFRQYDSSIENTFADILENAQAEFFRISLAAREHNILSVAHSPSGLPAINKDNYDGVLAALAKQKTASRIKHKSIWSTALALFMSAVISSSSAESNTTARHNTQPISNSNVLVVDTEGIPKQEFPKNQRTIIDDFCDISTMQAAAESKIPSVHMLNIDQIVNSCYAERSDAPMKPLNTKAGAVPVFSPLGATPYMIISKFNTRRESEPSIQEPGGGKLLCLPYQQLVVGYAQEPTCYYVHKGTDIVPIAEDHHNIHLFSILPGRVILLKKKSKRAGTYAVVEHKLPDGAIITTKYVHMKQFSPRLERAYISGTRATGLAVFKEGTGPVVLPYVMGGAPLGLMGETGNAKGIHLHFETKIDGVFTDPENIMPIPAEAANENNSEMIIASSKESS